MKKEKYEPFNLGGLEIKGFLGNILSNGLEDTMEKHNQHEEYRVYQANAPTFESIAKKLESLLDEHGVKEIVTKELPGLMDAAQLPEFANWYHYQNNEPYYSKQIDKNLQNYASNSGYLEVQQKSSEQQNNEELWHSGVIEGNKNENKWNNELYQPQNKSKEKEFEEFAKSIRYKSSFDAIEELMNKFPSQEIEVLAVKYQSLSNEEFYNPQITSLLEELSGNFDDNGFMGEGDNGNGNDYH